MKWKGRARAPLWGAALLLTMAGSAVAQTSCDATAPALAPSCARATTVTATVAHILRLELSTFNTTMAPPDLPQFDSSRVAQSPDQYPLTVGPLVTVRANRPWRLTIEPTSPSFTFKPDPLYQLTHPTGKPAADMTWSTSQASGFRPLVAETPQAVASNPSRGSFSQYTMYYRTLWRYDVDVPGTYALSISYTIIGQ